MSLVGQLKSQKTRVSKICLEVDEKYLVYDNDEIELYNEITLTQNNI